MKVLQVVPRFNPSLGGGVDVVYNLSKHLALRGHDVTVATTDYLFNADYAATIEDLGVEVIPFKHIFNYCLYIPSPSMRSWCRAHIDEYDVVHLNGTRSYQNSVVMSHAAKNKVPIVLQAHGSIMRIVERKGIKWLYDQVWGRKLLASASAFIALSQSEAEAHRLLGIAEEKIHVLPNGVDLERFKDLPERGEFRRKYGIELNAKVILYVGRLHKSKGIDLLIEAFADLVPQLEDVRLVLVGPDGGFKQGLQRLIADCGVEEKVRFTGFVSEREKYAAFIDSDVFVTPKFYGFPITFVESCAFGLPIITTNAGDYLDWIDSVAGISTEYDRAKLCEAMNRVLSEKSVRDRFSRGCRRLVTSRFNWATITLDVEKVYAWAKKGVIC
ncbi:MAG TPA: glycosyltransferase [Methanothrix sp.]|nr:glycosyltransferase [Methanothrix sp.]